MGSFSLIQETGRLNEKRKIGKQNKHIFDYAAMVMKKKKFTNWLYSVVFETEKFHKILKNKIEKKKKKKEF